MDLFLQFAVICAEKAFDDSGLELDKLNVDRCGVIWGSGIGGLGTFQEELKAYYGGNGIPRFSPFFIPKMIIDLAAGHISIKFNYVCRNIF